MTDRRMASRYMLSLPIVVRGPGQEDIHGITRDISRRGVYFLADQPLREATTLEFLLTVPPTVTGGNKVFLRARGQAVRLEHAEQSAEGRVGIAALIKSCAVVRRGSRISPV